ncbi:hypothetical protein HOA55_02445 [archaeon]|jgi:hypothetical protein|nr:hypothetical protein [archaeon]MBT3577838.1 hypothetical protein [archaeon]MBT6820189.1 hypothetical protein [archaeon]MBT6955780.1 hypothetical protein [archaeon]MBT7025300.1 hypothetical protein [archaeon]
MSSKESGGESYKSYQEFHRKFFPNRVLDRLDRTLCSTLGLVEDRQHRLVKSKNNPLAGTLALAKTFDCFYGERRKQIISAIKKFYRAEGFGAVVWGAVHAKRGDEHYKISLFDNETFWTIYVEHLDNQ